MEHSLKSALKRIDSGWSEININIFYRNIYTIYVTCGQISNLFVQALETGRNVMSKSQTLLSNCLQRAETSVILIVFNGVRGYGHGPNKEDIVMDLIKMI
jgi:hypothetical protein